MSAAVEASQDHDPFEVLRNANTVLLHNLRRDDASPELQKQLTTTGMAASSQAYFCDPYTNSYLGPQVGIWRRVLADLILNLGRRFPHADTTVVCLQDSSGGDSSS